MRERVLDRRELVAGGDARRESRAAMRDDVVVDRDFGQAPQPAPDAGRGTLLEQDRARALDARARAPRAAATPFCGRGEGNVSDAILDARDAIARDGTVVAARRAARADRRAEVHQRLRVRSRRRVRGSSESATRHSSPSDLRRARIARDAAMPREHALHVAVEDRGAGAERERGDRRRRRAADAAAAWRASRRRAETRRRARRQSPSRPHAGDARGGSSRVRSSARARDLRAPRQARARRGTRRESARNTG